MSLNRDFRTEWDYRPLVKVADALPQVFWFFGFNATGGIYDFRFTRFSAPTLRLRPWTVPFPLAFPTT